MIISPDAVNMTLPEDLEYACLYWIEHNCRVKGADSGILQSLEIFLFKHLWHWLEAMSILRATREVIGLLRKLASCLRSWLLQRVLIHSHGTGALIYLTRGVIQRSDQTSNRRTAPAGSGSGGGQIFEFVAMLYAEFTYKADQKANAMCNLQCWAHSKHRA